MDAPGAKVPPWLTFVAPSSVPMPASVPVLLTLTGSGHAAVVAIDAQGTAVDVGGEIIGLGTREHP